MSEALPRFVVGEVIAGTGYCNGELGEKFESLIAARLAAGYRLHSWSSHAYAQERHTLDGIEHEVTEHIVAVFERAQ